jgi:hypothetical protein
MDFAKLLRAAETLINVGQAATRFRRGVNGSAGSGPGDDGPDEEPRRREDLATGSPLFGQIEARMTGVLVAALKEAFDRDRAHLEMERNQLEHERRRIEELTRLEWLRQAGEREVAQLRSTVTLTLVVWVTSVVFAVLRGPGALGHAALALLGIGWALLFGALASALTSYRHVAGQLDLGGRKPIDTGSLAHRRLAPAITWLVVLGLACTAASVIASLA